MPSGSQSGDLHVKVLGDRGLGGAGEDWGRGFVQCPEQAGSSQQQAPGRQNHSHTGTDQRGQGSCPGTTRVSVGKPSHASMARALGGWGGQF